MGRLLYDSRLLFVAEDRALHHLQSVIERKLLLRHQFALGWRRGGLGGSGHGSAWVSPGVAIGFEYDDTTPPRLNAAWLSALMQEADRASGLRLIPEPENRQPSDEWLS